MAFVLDVSVVAGWIFEDQSSEYTDAIAESLRRDEALVPPIWHLELANLLRTARRRGRIEVAEAQAALAAIRSLPIRLDDRRTLVAEEAFDCVADFGVHTEKLEPQPQVVAAFGFRMTNREPSRSLL